MPYDAPHDDQLDRFALALRAARKVAAYPPAKPGQYVSDAKVYWPLIIELRDALDAAGIEWRTS
jgi:hypothetical protein